MRKIRLFTILVVIAFSILTPKMSAQVVPALQQTSSIKGKVKDSVYNYMLTSATVAIYKDADSSLLTYTLPNNFGEFTLQELPTEMPLRLIITHVGYRSILKKINLSKNGKVTDIGIIYLLQESGKEQLEEVVIKAIAPMRMNGDTLEFNADAFKLDSNATAEDLMRRLPGFTIWGDGDITFNGKKINQVLVNGKPFMGTNDITVATQNLPKNALSKIQIYQQRDEKYPLDSTMFANIKLKEDKQMGYFGKIGGGYGTDKRYTADGMLSGFNKKLQVSAVGGINNINKLASSADILMKNSSFKGEGANIDYQSDFTMRGINNPAAAGITFQYDFIPDPAYQKTSRLNADYFINHNQTIINNNTRTDNFITTDTILSRNSQSTTRNISTDQHLNSRYDFSNDGMSVTANASLSANNDKNSGESQTEQSKTGIGIIGTNINTYQNEIDKKNFTAGVFYTNRDNHPEKHRIPKEFTFSYQIAADESKGSERSFSKYSSSITPTNNKEFDRFYETRNRNSNNHTVKGSYPGVKKLIFNKHSLGGIDIGISGSLTLNNAAHTDRVLDKDTVTHTYIINSYLTNERLVQTKDLVPSLDLSKTFYKGLTNRYNKWVAINVHLRNQYFNFNSSAVQSIQNFSYSYARFIPNAFIEYNNHQYGNYEVKYALSFSNSVSYPGINNIAPLVDSSNQWFIPKGNPRIKPQEKRELAFGYSFTTRKPKNPLNLTLSVTLGKYEHNIADSTLFDDGGVRTVYAVNIDGNRYVNSSIGLKKAIELKGKSTVELDTRYSRNMGREPQYINNILNISNTSYDNFRINLGFRHRDVITLKAEEGLILYNSKQTGFNNSSFKSGNQYFRFIGTLQFPKNLLWSTNITYNKSDVNKRDAVYYTIWNAGITYRFLEGNRGEVKFSALDLLRQNKGVVNTISGNTQTFTTSNVLQHYYMVTLSYYPRKFGK